MKNKKQEKLINVNSKVFFGCYFGELVSCDCRTSRVKGERLDLVCGPVYPLLGVILTQQVSGFSKRTQCPPHTLSGGLSP